MDEAAWGALALTLTLLGGLYTWFAYQRRGPTAALRGAGLTLLPVAAWLTDSLKLLTRIGDAVGDWATRLAFSPSLWFGVILAGISVVLFVVAGFLTKRDLGTTPRTRRAGKAAQAKPTQPGALPVAPQASGSSAIDDEIEAILRKRGIT
jgi:hypothetical protein